MNYLQYLVENIHTVVLATVDEAGLPVTSIVDMLDYDENGLYFICDKDEELYNRLLLTGFVALSGTTSNQSISIRGKVRNLGTDKILNRRDIHLDTWTVFQIYEGQGEWFDLSTGLKERESFGIGQKRTVYRIDDSCISCGACLSSCPQECIDVYSMPAIIVQENCIHCGKCMDVCPMGSIHKDIF